MIRQKNAFRFVVITDDVEDIYEKAPQTKECVYTNDKFIYECVNVCVFRRMGECVFDVWVSADSI